MEEYRIKNFNEDIRRQINSTIEKKMLSGIESKESIDELIYNLYLIEDNEDKSVQVYRDFFIGVIYLDAYKMYSYKQKENIATEGDVDFFGRLYNIIDFDDLTSEVSADPGFFSTLVKASYDFHNLNDLGKVIVVRSLFSSENQKLLGIFPSHGLDLQDYMEPITLERLISNIKNQGKMYDRFLSQEFPEGIVFSVCGFIRNLFKVDHKNALTLCIEIANKDYKASKYLVNKVDDKDTLNTHIALYEGSSIEDIIVHMQRDAEFLFDAVYMLIDLYLNGKYNDIELTDDTISKSGDEGVLKKLVPNSNKND